MFVYGWFFEFILRDCVFCGRYVLFEKLLVCVFVGIDEFELFFFGSVILRKRINLYLRYCLYINLGFGRRLLLFVGIVKFVIFF